MSNNVKLGIAVGMIVVLVTVIFLAQKAVAAFVDISVGSLNAAGIETERSFYMVPAKITNLVGAYDDGVITLNWKPIKKAKLNGYRIYRGDAQGMETIIGSSIASGFTDGNIKKGQVYYYRVMAINDLGEGMSSNAARIEAR
ncbi:MAG: fibronectin type III domain-containing protein [Candidatus Colwellbacteria bacterium]|nr:fibronectin type III domain-containing protein [Candidatus Colwellbacteria bacterium]